MRQHGWRRRSVAQATCGLAACALLPLVGCQQHERQPLDLAAHRSSLGERTLHLEPIDTFLQRLREFDTEVPPSFSFDDGLSSAEGEVVALFYNADLREARLEAGVALARFEHAGLWEDPVFAFNGAEIWSPSSPFEYGLMLNLTIPVSGRLDAERERAGAAYEAELRRIVDAEWSTRAAVRSAWAAWSSADEHVRLHREVIGQIERISEIVGRLETAGELTRIEGRLFQVELAERRAAIAETEFQARRLRIELLSLMGLPPDSTIDLVPALPVTDQLAATDAIDRLIEHNTELAVKRAQYQAAEEALAVEIRKQYPDITIGSGYGSEDDDRLLLGVSIPIPILNANRGGIAEARAEREAARAAAETTFERLAREYALTTAALEVAQAQRAQYEREVVPMLAEQSAEVERLAELGDLNTLLLLDTVTRQFSAKSRLIHLRLAEVDAVISLSRLLGPEMARSPAPVSETRSAHAEAEHHDIAAVAAEGAR